MSSRGPVFAFVVATGLLCSVPALADEAAPSPAATIEKASTSGDRPRFVLGLNLGVLGAGLDVGLRYGVLQMGVGASTGIFSESYWAEAKVYAPVPYVVPYVAGRVGHYDHPELWDEDDAAADTLGLGLGLEVRPRRWLYLSAEAMYLMLDVTTATAPTIEDGWSARLGLGVAL